MASSCCLCTCYIYGRVGHSVHRLLELHLAVFMQRRSAWVAGLGQDAKPLQVLVITELGSAHMASRIRLAQDTCTHRHNAWSKCRCCIDAAPPRHTYVWELDLPKKTQAANHLPTTKCCCMSVQGRLTCKQANACF